MTFDPSRRLAFHRKLEAEAMPTSIGHQLDAVAFDKGENPVWISIDCEGPIRSYRELATETAKAANAFRSLGVVKGEHVGVMMPNGLGFLTAWLGLAKLGAVLVPLNPNVTAHELQHVLADGDVERALVTIDYLELFQQTDAGAKLRDRDRVILANGDSGTGAWEEMISNAADEFDYREAVSLDDPVSIIYTSGSTGQPKGCVQSHRFWLTLGKVKASLLPPCERILCELPFYYMSPYYRFSVAMFQAAAICVPPGPSIAKFYPRLIENRIDVAWIGDPIATLPYPSELGPHSLKHVSLYGLKPALHRQLEEKLGVPVRESFGMTEVGPGLYVPAEDFEATGTGTIGMPTPMRECKIGDSEGNEVPVGEVGELLITGPGMFQGYYGNPEMTEQAFWGKWFRTGDLARRDERGYYYIVGRIKEMIKRSSENIAAQEVESAIYSLPQVLEVAVFGVPDEKRGEEVKACVVLQDGVTPEDITPEILIKHCQSLLAKFKIPRYVQYYSEFPKTSSQKIAKKSLVEGGGVALTTTFDMLGVAA